MAGMKNHARSKTLLGAVAVLFGCAACCALPLLAGLGIAGAGGGLIAWFASHEIMFGLGVAVLIFALGAGWKASRLRRVGG